MAAKARAARTRAKESSEAIVVDVGNGATRKRIAIAGRSGWTLEPWPPRPELRRQLQKWEAACRRESRRLVRRPGRRRKIGQRKSGTRKSVMMKIGGGIAQSLLKKRVA